MNQESEFDVAILGGGLAGLTLARQLLMKRPETRIAVLEKRQFPVSETTHKVGESTVEIGAHYFGEQLQLKKHLTDHQLPKFGLRFFFRDRHQSLAEGIEVGGSEFFSAPSYQVDRGRLENYLAENATEQGATIIADASVKELEIGSEGESHAVVYSQGDAVQRLSARWLVDASGRTSLLKRKLDLAEDLHHEINSVWFRLEANLQIDGWCDDPQWRTLTGKVPRRWLSTNHLMGAGYWVWLIPLATGSTSVGIVADPRIHPLESFNSFEKSIEWLQANEPECAEQVVEHRDKMQDFLAVKKISRGAKQVFSGDRWALTGEAAALLDPFYSPGSDFIAIGNTMIGKLIEEDLAGNSIEHLAPTLQSVFLTLFHNNLLTYRDQYPLFGNPRIMALKFVWDYAVYWGFPALLYFNEKLTDVAFIRTLSKGIEEIREMNLKMQDFFRQWHEAEASDATDAGFVDQSQIEIMTRLNAELRERVDDATLKERFNNNVQLIRELLYEITDRIQRTQPQVAVELPPQHAAEPHLENVFEVLRI